MIKGTVNISLNLPKKQMKNLVAFVDRNIYFIFLIGLSLISIWSFIHFYNNGLGLAYNDARSHLNIGRRVVEGLKPGIAQLGTVWLPLPHLLMIPTIWNDFMWHSGLSGALQSMISFVVTGLLIVLFLKKLKVGLLGSITALFVFIVNINVLYLQSTAMTELLLIATMTIASYELLIWHETSNVLNLVKSAFWLMLSTLVRYDGWFLLAWASSLIILNIIIKYTRRSYGLRSKITALLSKFKNIYTEVEGNFIFYVTLGGFGIILWLLWNLLIFKDPLYFAFGPFSAKSQQDLLEKAGVLITKGNILFSIKFYLYAFVYNSGAFNVLLACLGGVLILFDKKTSGEVKRAFTTLIAPLFFNVIALYVGHSVLFIQGLSGDTWFNVRYGIMLMPAVAIFIGYLIDRLKNIRIIVLGLLVFVALFSIKSQDAVTIDDAQVGSSQKNVSEVSGWLKEHALDEKEFVLISAASHDAIIFSSEIPMKRFIHEGTGLYWENATTMPDRWARWIIMRTYDNNDTTWKLVKETKGLEKYSLAGHYPFADIYELKPEYVAQLNSEYLFKKQK